MNCIKKCEHKQLFIILEFCRSPCRKEKNLNILIIDRYVNIFFYILRFLLLFFDVIQK